VAARAVVRALADAGAREVVVVNRTRDRAETAAALAGAVGRVGEPDEVAGADLVVNATPIGMDAAGTGTDGDLPLDPERLGSGQLLVDLIYEPATTALVAAARARGVVAVNGLGMLIHQAAHAFRRWTGEDPPVEVMSAAATAELAHRGTKGPNGP
jgi:shikimate dehydrogenase